MTTFVEKSIFLTIGHMSFQCFKVCLPSICHTVQSKSVNLTTSQILSSYSWCQWMICCLDQSICLKLERCIIWRIKRTNSFYYNQSTLYNLVTLYLIINVNQKVICGPTTYLKTAWRVCNYSSKHYIMHRFVCDWKKTNVWEVL